MFRTALLWMLILLCSCSQQQPVHDFVKGSFASLQQRYHDRPHLIVFWSQDCVYCLKELTLFAKALSATQQVKLITVATDPFLAKSVIRKLHHENHLDNAEPWVFANKVPERLYFDVDKNWRGELPLVILVDKHNKVSKHLGAMTETELLTWVKQQSD